MLIDGWPQPGDGQWKIEKPLGTMFVWAPIPERLRSLGSLEFSKRLCAEAKVAVSPGIGFGEHGEGYVRFALVENAHRIRQAVRGIRRFLREGNEGVMGKDAVGVVGLIGLGTIGTGVVKVLQQNAEVISERWAFRCGWCASPTSTWRRIGAWTCRECASTPTAKG